MWKGQFLVSCKTLKFRIYVTAKNVIIRIMWHVKKFVNGFKMLKFTGSIEGSTRVPQIAKSRSTKHLLYEETRKKYALF